MPKRDLAAAKAFFSKAIKHQGQPPETITLNGYAALHRAVREMKADGLLLEDTKIRSSKYLNNLIEQDHRSIKSRTPEHEIHRLAGSIYRTVQMNPFATNFQVGFVNTLALDDPEPHKFAALSQQVKTLVS